MMPGTPAATTSFSASFSVVRAVGVVAGLAALAGPGTSVRLSRTVAAKASIAEVRGRWLGPPRRDGSLVGGGEVALGDGNTGFMRSPVDVSVIWGRVPGWQGARARTRVRPPFAGQA